MPRLPRFFADGYPIHLIQRGNNRQALFRRESDYRFLLDCLEHAAAAHGLAIHAYVLMTNHLHLLATPSTASSAPKTMQSIGRRYVQHFNRQWGRSGTLWEGRYRATIVDSESYLIACMRYIELNPVRAGLVRWPADYRWSSCAANAGHHEDPLVTRHELYRRLGATEVERREAYRSLLRIAPPQSEIEAIRDATNKSWALGGLPFHRAIEQIAGRRAAPIPLGRPRDASRKQDSEVESDPT